MPIRRQRERSQYEARQREERQSTQGHQLLHPFRGREKKMSEDRQASRAAQPDAQVDPDRSRGEKTAPLNFIPGANASPKLQDNNAKNAPNNRCPRDPRQPFEEPIQTFGIGPEPDGKSRR